MSRGNSIGSTCSTKRCWEWKRRRTMRMEDASTGSTNWIIRKCGNALKRSDDLGVTHWSNYHFRFSAKQGQRELRSAYYQYAYQCGIPFRRNVKWPTLIKAAIPYRNTLEGAVAGDANCEAIEDNVKHGIPYETALNVRYSKLIELPLDNE